MKAGMKHRELLVPFLGQSCLMCIITAVLTLIVAAGYAAVESAWQLHAMGLAEFLPSARAWEAAALLGVAVALFNITGDSVELDCDQGRRSLSPATYGLAIATTILVALALERATHGTWLAPYFRSWVGAALVAAFLATKLVAMRWHQKTLLFADTRMPAE